MEKNDIIDVLKLDQNLINEAFRRLVDGTFDLKAEDREFIGELFAKANQAVKDHIELEEEGFLPKIASEDASVMRREHSEMVQYLAEARYALTSARPVAFKALVSALKNAMIEHTKIETRLFKAIEAASFDHEVLASLKRRIEERVV